MKITRMQLRRLIIESLNEEEATATTAQYVAKLKEFYKKGNEGIRFDRIKGHLGGAVQEIRRIMEAVKPLLSKDLSDPTRRKKIADLKNKLKALMSKPDTITKLEKPKVTQSSKRSLEPLVPYVKKFMSLLSNISITLEKAAAEEAGPEAGSGAAAGQGQASKKQPTSGRWAKYARDVAKSKPEHKESAELIGKLWYRVSKTLSPRRGAGFGEFVKWYVNIKKTGQIGKKHNSLNSNVLKPGMKIAGIEWSKGKDLDPKQIELILRGLR